MEPKQGLGCLNMLTWLMNCILLSFQDEISKFQISNNAFIYPTNSRSRWLYIFDAYKIAKKIIHNSPFIIHNSLITCQDPFETGLAGWLVAKKFKLPLQLQIHTDVFSPYFRKESFLNKLRVFLAKFLIKRANCLRVVSERIKKSVLRVTRYLPAGHAYRQAGRHGGLRVTILPIFVDAKKIQQAPITVDLHRKYPQFDFIILMASRLTKEKNIKMAIEAMREIVKKHPKTGLIIVGSGPEEKNLKSQISNLKINENVKIEPWIDQLISYYKTADLFLLTSNYEGYARTVIEAMAAGCPVIMTDVGIAGELLRNKSNGLVIPVGDVKALCQAMLTLIHDKALRYNLIAAAERGIGHKLITKEQYLKQYLSSWHLCATS